MKLPLSCLLVLVLLFGCGKTQGIPPWTVVCDEKSKKFSFTTETGKVWIQEFNTEQDASSLMESIKRVTEELETERSRDRQKVESIHKKDWKICPNSPSPAR